MRKKTHSFLTLILLFVSTTAICQQIATGTYAFTNSATPIVVNLSPAGTISVTGLAGAINALNNYGVQSGGTVTFTFADNYAETLVSQTSLGGAGSALFGTAYSSITFKHTGVGTKPLITGNTGNTLNTDYIIRLLGADNITFDGIDLQENAANTTAAAQNEYGYYFLNSGGNGTQNNTIKNCKITLYNFGSVTTQQNVNSIGIFTSNNDNTTSNSGNVFSNDTITQAYNGISLKGISGYPDVGCIVNNCVIGSSTVGSIGGVVNQGSSGSDVIGLLVSYQNNFNIHDNIIQNCQYFRTGSGAVCYGIWLSNVDGNDVLYNNQIATVINQRVSSAAGNPSAGIELDETSGCNIDIYNNFIGNIQCVGATSSTFNLFGIRINGLGGTANLYHNSVYIPNVSSSQLNSSAAFYISASVGVTLSVKDNILKNAAQTSGSSKVYSFYLGSGNTLLSSNYNVLDVNFGNPTGIYYTGNYLGANEQTLANWQSVAGDANSHGINATFSTTTSPVLSFPSGYDANYQGVFIATPSITADIYGTTRIYPISGAYEPNFVTKQVIISANHPSDSLVSLGTSQQLLAGVALTVLGTSNSISKLTFGLSGTYSNSTVPHDFDSIKLWYNTTNSLSGATLLDGTTYADSTAIPAPGGSLIFNLSKSLPLGANYFFVTFNVILGGTPGHNIRITTLDSTKIVLFAGTNKIMNPANPLAQGGLQTIAQYYFNYPNTDITLTSSWYTNVGSGGNPPDFVSNNQVFVFTANTGNTMTAPWIVGGTNTRIDVGDIYHPLHSVTFAAKFPVVTQGNVVMNVRDSATVQFQSSYIPTTLGSLDQGTVSTLGSTVEYGDASAGATNDTLKSANYCNLTLSGSNSGTRTFPANVNVGRVFNPGTFTAPSPFVGNITFNGSVKTQIVPTGFAFRGLKINNAVGTTTLAGNISVDSTLRISSNLIVGTGQILTLTPNATDSLSDTLLVNGTLVNNNPAVNVFKGASITNLQFAANSFYNLSAALNGANSGQIPAASWDRTSTINITNVVGPTSSITVAAPGASGFGNINFDAPALAISPYYLFGGFNYNGGGSFGSPYLVTMQGNLTLGRTNNPAVTVDITNSGAGMSIFIGGNMTQNAGTYQLNNSGASAARKTLIIAGKDSINGNYVYTPSTGYTAPIQNLANTAGYGNVFVAGDFVMSGSSTLFQKSANTGKANLIFNGANGNQNATFTTITGDINFEVNKAQVSGGGDTVKLLSNAVADSFKLSKGVFSIGTHTLTINAGVVYPNPFAGGFTNSSGTVYDGSGTGTIAGSQTSNLIIGDSSSHKTAAAGTLKFAANIAGSPYNNYLFTFTTMVNSTATLGNALNIAAGNTSNPGTITINHDNTTSTGYSAGVGFVTGGFLTLKSNSNGTARVGANKTTSSTYISGNVVIERYAQAFRAWRLLTAPINSTSTQTINAAWQEGVNTTVRTTLVNPNPGFGTEITNTISTPSSTGYDAAATNNPSLLYMSPSNSWTPVTNTLSTKVNSQPGFMLFIRGSRNIVVSTPPFQTADTTVLRTTGSLNEGTKTYTLSNTGYQLFDNPYASELNLDSIFYRYKAIVGSTYVMWDPLLAGKNNVGGYVYATYSGVGNYSSFNAHVSPFQPGKIESGSAFFLNVVPGTAKIIETDKSTSSPLVFRPANIDMSSTFATQLNTIDADGTVYLDDGTLNIFSDEYVDSVNWQEDAQKIQNPGENLALVRNNKIIAIDKSKPLQAGDTIFLRLTQLKQGTKYRFTFAGSNINRPDLSAVLQDTYLGTSTPLSLTDESSTDFTVTSDAASQGSARFRIIFQNTVPLPVMFTNIKAWTLNNNINVQWNVTNEISIKEYVVERSTDGHSFTDMATVQATGTNTYNFIDDKATEGNNYYRIRCIDKNAIILYSEIVKVSPENNVSSITVYPNPAKNGVIGLQFSNMPNGIYKMRLSNTVGQQLFTSKITHNGGTIFQQIRTTSAIAKGIYQLEIIKPDESKITLSVVLQ